MGIVNLRTPYLGEIFVVACYHQTCCVWFRYKISCVCDIEYLRVSVGKFITPHLLFIDFNSSNFSFIFITFIKKLGTSILGTISSLGKNDLGLSSPCIIIDIYGLALGTLNGLPPLRWFVSSQFLAPLPGSVVSVCKSIFGAVAGECSFVHNQFLAPLPGMKVSSSNT